MRGISCLYNNGGNPVPKGTVERQRQETRPGCTFRCTSSLIKTNWCLAFRRSYQADSIPV